MCTKFFACLFYHTAFVVSWKIRVSLICLTTSVEWMSFIQLTVLSRSTIVVQSKSLEAFCVVTLFLDFSVGVGAFVIVGPSQISSPLDRKTK